MERRIEYDPDAELAELRGPQFTEPPEFGHSERRYDADDYRKQEQDCPLALIFAGIVGGNEGTGKCDPEHCAWWDRGNGCCAVLSVAQSLRAIHDVSFDKLEMSLQRGK